jgi:hypothetical protein
MVVGQRPISWVVGRLGDHLNKCAGPLGPDARVAARGGVCLAAGPRTGGHDRILDPGI